MWWLLIRRVAKKEKSSLYMYALRTLLFLNGATRVKEWAICPLFIRLCYFALVKTYFYQRQWLSCEFHVHTVQSSNLSISIQQNLDSVGFSEISMFKNDAWLITLGPFLLHDAILLKLSSPVSCSGSAKALSLVTLRVFISKRYGIDVS